MERHWAMSALRRFPNEILSEIFSFCVGGHSSLSVGPGKAISTISLDISQTCSRWRRVITALPRLWSSFHVNLQNIPDYVDPLIELYIARSGEHDLVIEFSLEDEVAPCWDRRELEENLGKCGIAAADLLVKYISRCGELDLSGIYWCLANAIFANVEEPSFPRLHTLTTPFDSQDPIALNFDDMPLSSRKRLWLYLRGRIPLSFRCLSSLI
ncbi:hypothetical protein E1B28_000376 [Marasmius oreades]|uniref:F-box domain-containing protein n=1 Tax=Marasmius oreades TaxID=181124 RepID=A0A9P7V162_9AGAR|nr:uncharacterized protein E1B28_000376 [Marasmius oreades]KAG7098424.1 hypothetical protein E1B28_000376 [Marasmius oreades]